MNAVVINPDTRTIEAVDMNPELSELYAAVGCQLVTTFAALGGTCYCDDEGLFRPTDDNGCLCMTVIDGYAQPIVGTIVVFGPPDREGYDTACRLTAEQVAEQIRFISEPPPEPTFRIVAWDDL